MHTADCVFRTDYTGKHGSATRAGNARNSSERHHTRLSMNSWWLHTEKPFTFWKFLQFSRSALESRTESCRFKKQGLNRSEAGKWISHWVDSHTYSIMLKAQRTQHWSWPKQGKEKERWTKQWETEGHTNRGQSMPRHWTHIGNQHGQAGLLLYIWGVDEPAQSGW